jgi:hypothetical protein
VITKSLTQREPYGQFIRGHLPGLQEVWREPIWIGDQVSLSCVLAGILHPLAARVFVQLVLDVRAASEVRVVTRRRRIITDAYYKGAVGCRVWLSCSGRPGCYCAAQNCQHKCSRHYDKDHARSHRRTSSVAVRLKNLGYAETAASAATGILSETEGDCKHLKECGARHRRLLTGMSSRGATRSCRHPPRTRGRSERDT